MPPTFKKKKKKVMNLDEYVPSLCSQSIQAQVLRQGTLIIFLFFYFTISRLILEGTKLSIIHLKEG